MEAALQNELQLPVSRPKHGKQVLLYPTSSGSLFISKHKVTQLLQEASLSREEGTES